MLESRIMDRFEEELDIRTFFKMHLDVRLLLKRTLTRDQKKLFAL